MRRAMGGDDGVGGVPVGVAITGAVVTGWEQLATHSGAVPLLRQSWRHSGASPSLRQP